jgi:hypothetical protein
MYIHEKDLIFYIPAFIEVFFYFLFVDFFLLRPCTTEQWLTYYWWYACHSLTNHVLKLVFMNFVTETDPPNVAGNVLYMRRQPRNKSRRELRFSR